MQKDSVVVVVVFASSSANSDRVLSFGDILAAITPAMAIRRKTIQANNAAMYTICKK
jgi:hypothetical protein